MEVLTIFKFSLERDLLEEHSNEVKNRNSISIDKNMYP